MKAMHSLLQRQLKRHMGAGFSIPAEWHGFLDAVNEAYVGSDTDRALLEHSLVLSSQELLDSYLEMQAVVQAIPDLVFRLDHEGIVVDVKAGVAGESTIGRQELMGKRLQDTPLREVAAKFAEATQRLMAENAPVTFEYSGVCQGHESDFEARLVPLPERQIVVIIRNITERKQSLRLLGAAVDQSAESIMITDVELDLPGPRILFVNPAFTRMTGYSSAEILGGTPRILQGPKSDPTVMARMRETLRRGEVFQGETVNYRKDGTEFNLEWEVTAIRNSSGLATHFLGIQRDVTARKRTEAALRASNEKFHQLADNITDVFWIRSPDMREVYYVSPAFEQIWGRPVAMLYAHPERWIDYILPEDRERVANATAALAGHAASVDMEYRIVRIDGEVRWVHVRGFQVRNAAHKIISLTGIVTDITARKRAELELAQAHTQLVAVSRQAGMAEFATGILHNIGNVLNSVNVASTCMAENLRASKSANLAKVVTLLREHEHDLGEFLTANARGRQVPVYLAHLADALAGEQALALAELAGLQRNIQHIKDVVTSQQSSVKGAARAESLEVAELLEATLRMDAGVPGEGGIEIIREFSPVPTITFERHKVLQILINLVRNAKQSCLEAMPTEKRVTLGVTNGNDRVRITVGDNGVGIAPGNLSRIFAHGFTTKKDGHGFGLHSAQAAATDMGGSLQVQSEGLGRGATFILELPLSARLSRP